MPVSKFTRLLAVVFVALSCLTLSCLVLPPGTVSSGTSLDGPCWRPPAAGRVVDPFREPACPWCAGNRGIEYSVGSRTAVRAVAPGVVTFSGDVAGVDYVVVRLDNGWRHTYGRLVARGVAVGDRVSVAERVGVADRELFFGLRIGAEYADPAPWIGVIVARPRLIPTDGSPARPAPPSTLRCAPVAEPRARQLRPNA